LKASSLVLLIVAGLLAAAVNVLSTAQTAPPQQEVVVSYHPRATEIGLAILRSGGNAVDAFVAATMAEYVLAEGGTSMAGQVGALVYDAKKRAVEYLDAGFNNVGRPDGIWKSEKKNDPIGKKVPVPGAIAGLEALANRYGTRKFADLIEPAAKLAREGFPITGFYACMIESRGAVLQGSGYFKKTYFPKGKALQAGDTLRQPEVAAFLATLQAQGSGYMYRGEWAKQLVETVRERGGLMSANDLAAYKAAWHAPLKATYRNHEIYGSSGRNYGGLSTLLALKALENVDIAKSGHFTKSADALEIMVRVARSVRLLDYWVYDYRLLDDRRFVDSRLTSEYGSQIWSRVKAELPKPPVIKPAPHSYHIIVIDKNGNAVTGTNTYQQTFPWGEGVFVQGVFLPNLEVTLAYPVEVPTGSRRMDGLTMHLVFQKGALRAASGAIADSLIESSYQYLVNLIDYGMTAKEAVSSTAFGTFDHKPDLTGGIDWSTNLLRRTIDPSIVRTLERRGLKFQQTGTLVSTGIDSGLGGVAVVRSNGTVEGEAAPWPGVNTGYRNLPTEARDILIQFPACKQLVTGG
jgi:gamma-glutamyltranspeptidase/glutathione hydrolase